MTPASPLPRRADALVFRGYCALGSISWATRSWASCASGISTGSRLGASGLVSSLARYWGRRGQRSAGTSCAAWVPRTPFFSLVGPLPFPGSSLIGYGPLGCGGGANRWFGSRITSWSRSVLRRYVAYLQLFIASRILPRVGPPPPSRSAIPPWSHFSCPKGDPPRMTSDVRDPTKIDVALVPELK